jgi:hypothetical protein
MNTKIDGYKSLLTRITTVQKNRNITVCLLMLVFIMSCTDTKKQVNIKEYYCEPDTTINLYSDSSFFGHLSCMQYFNDKIYALDTKRKDIAVFNETFDSISFIGKQGHGPGEFSRIYPPLYIHDDTLDVMDWRGFSRFYKDRYIDLIRLPVKESGRFAYRSGKYYLPHSMPASTFVVAPAVIEFNPDSLIYGGIPVKFSDEKRTVNSNHRHLLIDEKYFYLISYNLPIIEKYDINTLELVSSFNISDIPVIQQNLEYAQTLSLPPNAYYNSVRDGYIFEDILYLLSGTPPTASDQNSSIVRISLYPEMKALDVLTFKGYHTTFCVSPNYIFTFCDPCECITRLKKLKSDE